MLLGLTESIAFAVELDDFGTVDETVDEGDDMGGGGEHVGPLREGFVRRDEHRQVEVSARDDLEEEVGVAVEPESPQAMMLRLTGIDISVCRRCGRGALRPIFILATQMHALVPVPAARPP